jgi:hypothetical protein
VGGDADAFCMRAEENDADEEDEDVEEEDEGDWGGGAQ